VASMWDVYVMGSNVGVAGEGEGGIWCVACGRSVMRGQHVGGVMGSNGRGR
jgi:hypothetical protein